MNKKRILIYSDNKTVANMYLFYLIRNIKTEDIILKYHSGLFNAETLEEIYFTTNSTKQRGNKCHELYIDVKSNLVEVEKQILPLKNLPDASRDVNWFCIDISTSTDLKGFADKIIQRSFLEL